MISRNKVLIWMLGVLIASAIPVILDMLYMNMTLIVLGSVVQLVGIALFLWRVHKPQIVFYAIILTIIAFFPCYKSAIRILIWSINGFGP